MKFRTTSAVVTTVIALLIAERFVLSALIPLIPQEAYYWMYARHPEMSYFDHPPMVAWIIQLGTAVFGSTEFGVRVVGELLTLACVGLMYRLTQMMFRRPTALLAAAGLIILPLYFHIGWLATMDSALVFFWLMAMWGFVIAVDRNDARGWCIAGAGAGAAMLSKYTGVFCLAGMFLAMLLHQPWRVHLRRSGFWLACVGSLVMFTPVILWNASHHWVSFQFQFVERFAHPVRPWAGIAAALGGQAAIAAPLAVLAAASIAVRGRRDLFRLSHRRWSKRIIFAAAFSLPLLAVLAVESVRTNVHINWAAPAYLSLMPLAAQQFRRLRRLPISRPIAVNARRSVVATSLGCAIVSAVSLPYVAFVHPNSGFLAYEFGPWPGLALEINHVEEQLERESGREPLVVADGPFELASEIAFYRARMGDDMDGDDDQEHRNAVTGKIVHVIGEAPPCSTTTSQWFFGRRPGNAFPFWLHRRDWVGCDVIYVSPYTDIPGEIAAQTDSATLVALPYLGGKRHYNVIICRCLHQLAQATSTK